MATTENVSSAKIPDDYHTSIEETGSEGLSLLTQLETALHTKNKAEFKRVANLIQTQVNKGCKTDLDKMNMRLTESEIDEALRTGEGMMPVATASHGDRIYFDYDRLSEKPSGFRLYMPIDEKTDHAHNRWQNFAEMFGYHSYTDPRICDANHSMLEVVIKPLI